MSIALGQPAVPGATPEETALLREVERFALDRVGPLVARPESPMDRVAFAALLDAADELGLAGSADAPSGLGIWERLGDDSGSATSLASLEILGRRCPAVAYALHQRALARATCRRLGMHAPGPLAIAPRGRFGLGRTAFGTLVAGRSLDAEARALLADLYAPAAPRIVTVEHAIAGLWTPALDNDGRLHFQLHLAPCLARRDHPHAHGLDELATLTLSPSGPPVATARDETRARTVLGETCAAEQLALVAISTGAVARALEGARAFAGQRRQGGKPIAAHAAILDLLGQATAAVVASQSALGSLGSLRLGPATLAAVLATRAALTPLLADAANATLQVFGGLGYMRDNGIEKIVRDVNHLRSLGGAPAELQLVVAAWDTCDG